MEHNNTLNNPNSFHDIDPKKMQLINNIMQQSKSLSAEQRIPFFLSAAANAQSNGIRFSERETDLILNALKTNMTPAQANQIDTVRRLSAMLMKKNS